MRISLVRFHRNLCLNSEYDTGVDGRFSICEIVIVNGLNSLANVSLSNWWSSIVILTKQSWIVFGKDNSSSRRQVIILYPEKKNSDRDAC